MTTLVIDRTDRPESAKVGARISATRRAKRPLPATRDEADRLFSPSAAYTNRPASAPRLVRMQALGLIPQYTNAEAHQLILDALYPCDPGATPEGDTPSPTT